MATGNNIFSRLRSQQGMALVELLIAIPITVILVGVSFVAYNVSAAGQARSTARSEVIVEQKNVLEKITRDLRQADHVESVPAGSWTTGHIKAVVCKDFEGCDDSQASDVHQVEYWCIPGFASCLRQIDSGGWVQLGVNNLSMPLDANVFRLYRRKADGTLQPNADDPTYVDVKLVNAPKWTDQRRAGWKPLVLEQTVSLPNVIDEQGGL
jgi:hypothetical protein